MSLKAHCPQTASLQSFKTYSIKTVRWKALSQNSKVFSYQIQQHGQKTKKQLLKDTLNTKANNPVRIVCSMIFAFVHCVSHARLGDKTTFILGLECLEFVVHRLTWWFVSLGLLRGRYTGFCYSERWQSTFHIILPYAHGHVHPV